MNRERLTTNEGLVPPQAIDFEKAVLGVAMIQKDSLERIPALKPEHFYDDNHGIIFSAIHDLYSNSNPVDMLTVTDKLQKMGKLEDIGGMLTIAQLTSKVSSSANIEYHGAVIMQKYMLREIISAGNTAIQEAYNPAGDPESIQADMFASLEKTKFNLTNEAVDLGRATTEYLKELQQIQETGSLITGIDTGYHKINYITNGWRAPNLMILAGRPGTGKTASALNFAYKIAVQKVPVGFFSLEMSTKEVVSRLVSISSGVSSGRLRNADLLSSNWESIHASNFNLPFFIDDSSTLTITDFKGKARRMVKRHGVKFIVVDYLQLMSAPVKGNRDQEIGAISRGLKATAKELNVPILALAQLSRDVERRGADARPRLSDLRESGNIEQDADAVIFMFDPNSTDKSIMETPIEFIWAKHRGGACLSADLMFHKQTQQFLSI